MKKLGKREFYEKTLNLKGELMKETDLKNGKPRKTPTQKQEKQ